jgi:GNAT superfamily N-acetyltransferase
LVRVEGASVSAGYDSVYDIVERLPTVEEHRALFEAVGWTPYAPEAAEIALRHSLHGVLALHEGQVIGIGRVVGDGGKFFYIQDFAVRPEHQGRGVGTRMLERLLVWIKAHAPHEAFVGLFATGTAIPFYQKHDFDERRDVLSGMWTVLAVDNTDPAP